MDKTLKTVLIVIGSIVSFFLLIGAVLYFTSFLTVSNAIDKAKQKSFKNEANIVARWVEKQYSYVSVGLMEEEFVDLCGVDGKKCDYETKLTLDLLDEVDIDYEDINLDESTLYIDNYRACVKLVASSYGDYKGLEDVYSSGCN